MKISRKQIKNSTQILTNGLDTVEDRIPELEDKLEELQHSNNDKEKKKYK
jgi:hypothetical protein